MQPISTVHPQKRCNSPSSVRTSFKYGPQFGDLPFPFTLAISISTSVKHIFSRPFSTQRADCRRILSDLSNGEAPSSGHLIRGLPSLFLSLLFVALKFHIVLVMILSTPLQINQKDANKSFIIVMACSCITVRPPIRTAQVFLFICLCYSIHKYLS